MNSDFTDYLAAQAALESAQADITVAEFHGTFCALMCTRAPVDTRAWVDEIVVHGLPDDTSEDGLWRDCLVEIADLTSAAFVDGECNLEILLPDDDQTLQERSQALVDWCSGFLFGIGLQPAAVCGGLSADSQEVIPRYRISGLTSRSATTAMINLSARSSTEAKRSTVGHCS